MNRPRPTYPTFRWTLANGLAVAGAFYVSVYGQGWRTMGFAIIGTFILTVFLVGMIAPSAGLFVRWWRHGSRGDRRVALTFDDGPDTHATGPLLDLLKARHARATFFCIGRRAEYCPELCRRIVDEGHELGNHTFSHRWGTNLLLASRLRAEIERGQLAIRNASGITPALFRPPMGLTNPHTGPTLLKLGMPVIGWDIRPFDRLGPSAWVAGRVVRKLRPGSVVLLHDGGADPTRLCQIVALILDAAEARGLAVAPVGELMKPLNSQ